MRIKKIIKDKDFFWGVFWKFLKLVLTVYIIILIPVYWHYYGPENFLWLSDLGLFLTIIGLWLNSRLIISMAAVGLLFVELTWNIDFFVDLFFNINLIHLSDYMFDSNYSIILRVISLFHVFVPIIWIIYLLRYGYEKKAIYYFTVLYWISLFLTYFLTDPKENISWVFLPEIYNIKIIPEPVWILILFVGSPILIFLPTHYIFTQVFKTS